MKIVVKIEQKSFELPVGKGYNDWVWLSQYAARVFSRDVYPRGTYIPCYLYLQTKNREYQPHPRQRIKYYLQSNTISFEEIVAHIKIRKVNHLYTEYEKKWQSQAYGQEKYLSETSYSYKVSNINRKKDFYFKIMVYFNIHEEVRCLVDESKYKNTNEIVLEQRQVSSTESFFEASIKLPYGTLSHKLFYYERESENDEYYEVELTENKIKKQDFNVTSEPKYIPTPTINNLINQDMKISESITQSLHEKQIEAKRRNNNSALCCFTFEDLWAIIEEQFGSELSLKDYEETSKQRIKVALEDKLAYLYEIFFYYFIIQNQQKDKKEDLSINYQDVLHFLFNYQVFIKLEDLLNFFQYYNENHKFKKIEDTVNVLNFGIKFPQFVVILLRSIQFIQTSTFMMKGETFDTAVSKIFDQIQQLQEDKETGIIQMSSQEKNLRENVKLIPFVKSYSDNIKKIFINMAVHSIQNSGNQFVIRKEQICYLLHRSQFSEKNIDQVVKLCYLELKLKEEGLFYYDFLSVIQFLALTLVNSEQDMEENSILDDQERNKLLIEKVKFFIDRILAYL